MELRRKPNRLLPVLRHTDNAVADAFKLALQPGGHKAFVLDDENRKVLIESLRSHCIASLQSIY